MSKVPLATKVSVIVPVYNVEPYISKCLSSLMGQTMQELEFIIVDDCGTDRSMDIAREYAARDPRFRILEGIINQGAGSARNRGMDAAKGEFIGFVDPDDWVAPDFFQLLYEKATSEQADVAKGGRCRIYGDRYESDPYNTRIRQCLQQGKWVGLSFKSSYWTAIYRRSIQQQYNIVFPPLRNGEDDVFLLRYLLRADKVVLEEIAMYFYFQRHDSISYVLTDEYFDSVFEQIKIRGDIINKFTLNKEDVVSYWHGLFSSLAYHLGRATNPPHDFYVTNFTRIKSLFLNCGYALELCAAHPSSLYSALLEKTPEKITAIWLNPPPPLHKVSRLPNINVAPCAWRYPIYRRRFWYCRFMAALTFGKKRCHYERKREAYRQLIRSIRNACRNVTMRLGLPW